MYYSSSADTMRQLVLLLIYWNNNDAIAEINVTYIATN
jgi:hypothetical protein